MPARTITVRGETLTIGEWAERLGVPRQTIYQRLRLGWPAEQAVSAPVGERSPGPPAGTEAPGPPSPMLTIAGETRRASAWAREHGVSRGLLSQRVAQGWSLLRAATTPPAPPESTAKRIAVDGEALTVREWAERLGVGRAVIYQRLRAGWSPEDAVTTPPGGRPRSSGPAQAPAPAERGRTARRLGARQRSVLEQLDADPRTYAVGELAEVSGAPLAGVYSAVRSLASRGLVATWTTGSGPDCTRYVAPAGTEPPDGAELEVLAKAGAAVDLERALPIEEAPDRARLISYGQAQVRTGADGHVLSGAIAAGLLPAYRAPAGPRARRDAVWLDQLDVDRWAAARQSVARRDEWVVATVHPGGDATIPVWPLGAQPGQTVEYRIEGDEIRIRRSSAPRAPRTGGRPIPPEARREAVRRVVEDGESQSEVGRSMGVSHRAVGLWIEAEHGCTLSELRAREASGGE